MTDLPEVAVPDASVKDIARLLKISVRAAYRLAENGEIPSYRVGGKLRFDLAEVAAGVRATRRGGQS